MPDTHGLTVRNLDAVTEDKIAVLAKLNMTPAQDIWGGSILESLSQWHLGFDRNVLGFGFFVGSSPIGLVLIKRPPASPVWVQDDAASMHGLKIAPPWQRRGLGRLAFSKTVAAAIQIWPDRSRLMLAVDADNAAALAVYRGTGLADSGPIYRNGRGLEHRMEVSLEGARHGKRRRET